MPDAAQATLEALMQFLYQAPIGLVQARLSGEITMINPMSAQLLMPLAAENGLNNLLELLDPIAPQLRGLVALAGEPASGGVVCEGLRLALPNPGPRGGPGRTLSLRMLKLDAHTLMASLHDITHAEQQEQQRLASRLRDVQRTDGLTQMPNRAVMRERIEGAIVRSRREPGHRCAVLFINGDRFNRVNLALGAAAGDELLQRMAERLNGMVRAQDSVGRAGAPSQTAASLGGDEFVVLLEGLRDSADALVIAQRMVDTLCQPYALSGQVLHSSCSIGVVLGMHATGTADAVLQDASLAVREAKRCGGRRYSVFDPALKDRVLRRTALEGELRHALQAGQLFVVYQPIVHLDQGAPKGTAGVEALVRWQHPQRGLLSPLEFIEIAEETGLIGALGHFVLNTACRQLVQWQRELGPLAPQLLSVNLSRAQLLDPSIAEQVQAALRDSGLAARQLQLEVTESLAAQDEVVRGHLQALKALGLSVALDDFGTGYSSLASLHLLPIDVVKIDRSFVSQSETSEHHRVLIEATVRVAQSLGMRTVAEGIETAGQSQILTALHCDKGQGYLYARPMTAEALSSWLQRPTG